MIKTLGAKLIARVIRSHGIRCPLNHLTSLVLGIATCVQRVSGSQPIENRQPSLDADVEMVIVCC